MKLDLLFLPSEIRNSDLQEKLVIVIDVLRASSTIVTALSNGAKDIIPVESQEDATRLMQEIGRKYVLLCGERGGQKIEGFDLGNSPFEYTNEVIQEKTLIFCSTNGSRAIVKASAAAKVMVGCFINLGTVLENVLESKPKEVVLLCSGKEDRFSLEDTVCAGMMVSRLKERLTESLELSDSAQAGLQVYGQHQKSLLKMLNSSLHGKYLLSLGFQEDLVYCSQVDSIPVVPVLETGHLVKAPL
jgi:2-phosphosulfolactate phosphatase